MIRKAIKSVRNKGVSFPSAGSAINGADSFLPPIAKKALGVTAVVAIIYAAYKIIPKILAPDALGAIKDSRTENKEVDKELGKIINTATISNSQAAGIANSIFTAMDGYGTDEIGIVNQFKKIKNNADFLKLQKAYGTRVVSSGKWNPEPNYKGNLVGALGSECSAYWTIAINKSLSSKGVTYRV
tara:strand:- start:2854 stop:3408 length:555 start_codon:yes stop_codon:yes gene_type:complete